MRGIEEERSLDGVEADSSEAFRISLRKIKVKLDAAFKNLPTPGAESNAKTST